ncbi:MAG: hypothetical protein LBF97_03270 [Elusimicrobiota bacterium]|jgi:hypothetical protein|nr:hypothetical protein [Elusimicrobiota bacterium]
MRYLVVANTYDHNHFIILGMYKNEKNAKNKIESMKITDKEFCELFYFEIQPIEFED